MNALDISKKSLSNTIESNICDILRVLVKDYDVKVNHCNGIDLELRRKDVIMRFEIKSAFRFIRMGKGNYRNGRFYFKKNELKADIEGYLFVEKINRRNNIDSFREMRLFFVYKSVLLQYFKENNFALDSIVKISINSIRRIHKIEFLDYLKTLNGECK